MPDRALRMFTWVYLAAFKELSPEKLIETHIERMAQLGFDAEMSKNILVSVSNQT